MSKLKNYISIIIMLALIAVVGVLLLTGVLDVDETIAAVRDNKPAALLAIIGGNMIKEALSKDEEEHDASFAFKAMLPLAVATSIDALAVGISFAFLGVDIVPAALLIGITTFVLSAVGVYVGNAFGAKYKSKAELVGGVVLILIGLKILLEHLGMI